MGPVKKSHQHLAPVFLNAWICHVFSFLLFFGLGISRELTMPEMACQKKSQHFYRSPWVLTRSGGQNVSYGQQIGELNLAKRVTQKDGRCLSERVPWTKLLLEHFMRLMPPLKRWWMDEKCKYIFHITHTHIYIHIQCYYDTQFSWKEHVHLFHTSSCGIHATLWSIFSKAFVSLLVRINQQSSGTWHHLVTVSSVCHDGRLSQARWFNHGRKGKVQSRCLSSQRCKDVVKLC